VPIEFTCPLCGKLLRAPDERAGARAICPECREPIAVPAPQFAETAAWGSAPPSASGLHAAETSAAAADVESQSCPGCGAPIRSPQSWCNSCGATLADLDRPAPRVAGYAGFWKRVAAALLDWLILGTVMEMVSNLPVIGHVDGAPELVIAWLYHAYLESSEYQATVGKMALGIVVTDLHGGRVSFGRATARFFAKLLSVITFFVGFIMAAFTERKQTLHDLVAECLVLKKS